MERNSPTRWVPVLIVSSSEIFVAVLALSAVYDPSIRVLHLFQAIIYLVVVILCLKQSAWGYGAGTLMAAFWNYTNLVHTTFITNGVRALSRLLATGELRRPDQLISVVAATAHFLLIAACVVGFLCNKPGNIGELAKFFGGGMLAIIYFSGIILLYGPQYVPLLKRVFGI
jgi:hypothetical protein